MKYKDELQAKIAKEYGLDKLITNHEDNKLFNESTKEWYFKQMDKFIATLKKYNGATDY